jgi:cytochrome P450
MKRAREEVDRVLGYRFPTIEDTPKFVYIDQILKESLRLQPTAPVLSLS